MLKEFDIKYIPKSAEIFRDIFTNRPWNYEWMSDEKVHEYFTDLINTPKAKAYAFFINDTLCGACFGRVNSCSPVPVYEINEIFVLRDLQKKGVGSKMLKAIEQDLKQKGIVAISLYTMRDIPAYKYYIKNGYEEASSAVSFSKVL